jgi:hypothetical protein
MEKKSGVTDSLSRLLKPNTKIETTSNPKLQTKGDKNREKREQKGIIHLAKLEKISKTKGGKRSGQTQENLKKSQN